jgi:hypothetical protein
MENLRSTVLALVISTASIALLVIETAPRVHY